MADMITRCPQCGTAFRITPAHLKSARGSVRCGSCLHVFNAKDHLDTTLPAHVNAAQPTEAKAVSTPPPTTTRDEETAAQRPQESAASSSQDDLLISDDMDTSFPEDDAFPDETGAVNSDDYLPPDPPSKTSLFERSPSPKAADEEEEEPDDDESWALKLLDEEDSTPAPGRSTVVHPSAARSGAPIEEEPEADDPWDEHLVHADEVPEDDTWYELSDADADIEESYAVALSASRREGAGSTYLDAIEPEPVEFAYKEKQPFWRSRWFWGCLSSLAFVLLLVQVAWLQYPRLNRVEPYRSWYASACVVLGCQLPPQQDVSAIRTSNLVVRSHPNQANALMVDVILQNTAPFTQAFPGLALTFSNLQGDVVAQRVFGPNQYLGGEMTGQSQMPIRQPVHIALAIVDPGPTAVNYRVEVVDPPATGMNK